jgi:hypothetical protein
VHWPKLQLQAQGSFNDYLNSHRSQEITLIKHFCYVFLQNEWIDRFWTSKFQPLPSTVLFWSIH